MKKGFSLLELLIVMATLFIITSITIPLLRSALLRAQVGALAADAKVIHVAFKRFFIDNNMYPNSTSSPAFQVDSFQPLVDEGYYDAGVLGKLADSQVDDYDSPDDRGVNQEFWLEMTLAADPAIRFLVADSDNAPLGGGGYYNGVYMYKNGVLTPLASPVATD